MAPRRALPSHKVTNWGAHPVSFEAQPLSCMADRNSCRRNGLSPASAFHSDAEISSRESIIFTAIAEIMEGVAPAWRNGRVAAKDELFWYYLPDCHHKHIEQAART